MRIGITYDLRQDYLDLGYGEEETAEFDQTGTIEAIEHALQSFGFATDRIGNIWNLTNRLADGDRWDLVFNIAEGLRGIGREAQVPALLDAYDIPYTFSDPLVLALTLHKGMTKRVLRDLGIPTPDFVEVQSMRDVNQVNLPYPLFAKPIAEGTGKGVTPASKIHNLDELRRECDYLLATYKQPVLVETFLPGREFTVGIVGTGMEARSVGVIEVILNSSAEQHAYSYINKEQCEELVQYVPVDDEQSRQAVDISLATWCGLGCRDAGRVDVRVDANGLPNVMEVNPLAGIHPEHSDLPIICTIYGITYRELFEMILQSAMQRVTASTLIDYTVKPQEAVLESCRPLF
ncbi:ATP-grasp domain-containing protein [candidate division KSB1 bacterium]|nr:ATP-grasp domain-containing protein [candidate division KSB1 bacterium]RQW01967.1 MAG: ATP-grasp domain-containing protein [candidate division KSB1 bacterium]